MTKVGKIIYEEQVEAINEALSSVAENYLRDGDSLESVSRNTGLDMATVEALAKKVAEQRAGSLATTV